MPNFIKIGQLVRKPPQGGGGTDHPEGGEGWGIFLMTKTYGDIDREKSFMKFELNPKIRYTETYCEKIYIFDVFQRKFIISNQYL